jgi:hypothetical protein
MRLTRMRALLQFCALAAVAVGAPLTGLAQATPAKSAQTAPANVSKPAWVELSPAHKTALAPLSGTWESLPADQKAKWVQIAGQFPSMKAEEQARAQARMRDWAALTPEQRAQARENFQKAKSVPKDAKQAQWEQYQALPEDRKKAIAEKAAAEKKSAPGLPPAGK